MQQSTVCLYFAWRTTSLRVGGWAARRSCLPGLRRGGGGRQAGATVLSCQVWRCKLSRPDRRQVRSASECVWRSHRQCLRHPTHSDVKRTCRAVRPTQFTQPHQTQGGPVSCLVCRCELAGASTPYKRWSKCTMNKIGGRFLQELRGEVRKLFMHSPPLSFLQLC